MVCDAGDLAEGEIEIAFSPTTQNCDICGVLYAVYLKTMPGEMKQVDVGGHPVLLCRDQGHLKVHTTFVFRKSKPKCF